MNPAHRLANAFANIHATRFKPINTSLYLCDNKFHTEALDELLEDDEKFGFIVMDGNGSLYGAHATIETDLCECLFTLQALFKVTIERCFTSFQLIYLKSEFASRVERYALIIVRHGRGGQSALRFARLRMEKRHNYVRKVSELAVQMFITADKPNVSGLVLAGSADFKSELQTSDMFDQRLAFSQTRC